MSNWQIKAMSVIDPLLSLLKKQIKTGEVLNMDETTVQVMNKETAKAHNSHICGWE
jgi:hypothetical protein